MDKPKPCPVCHKAAAFDAAQAWCPVAGCPMEFDGGFAMPLDIWNRLTLTSEADAAVLYAAECLERTYTNNPHGDTMLDWVGDVAKAIRARREAMKKTCGNCGKGGCPECDPWDNTSKEVKP